MSLKYYVIDFYDWDSDKNLPASGNIGDADMAMLHSAGVAKEYEVKGYCKIKLQWSLGERFQNDVDGDEDNVYSSPTVIDGPNKFKNLNV